MPLNDDRGLHKVWGYGALRVRDGQALTQTARFRATTGYLDLLQTLDRPYPTGDRYLIADHLASHTSGPMREWLADHPRIQHAFIPVGAALDALAQPDRGLVRTVGASSGAMPLPAVRWPATATLRTSPVLPPLSSTDVPCPGSGDGRPSRIVPFVAALCTAYEERRMLEALYAQVIMLLGLCCETLYTSPT